MEKVPTGLVSLCPSYKMAGFRGHDEAWLSEDRLFTLNLDSRFRRNDRAWGVQMGEAPLRY